MKTLFVETELTELRYERQAILVYQKGKRISSVPVCSLERVVLSPKVILTSGVLGLLSESKVALFVFNARYPRRSAYLAVGETTDVSRRVKQYELLKDDSVRLTCSKIIVRAKIRSQLQLLLCAMKRRPDLRKPFFDSVAVLRRCKAAVLLNDNGLASLRGVEGAASASFFKAYKALFPSSLGFFERNRRPPKDPVNSLLSLSYTLMYYESIAALKCSGLDPMLGVYHEIYHGRDSLACDFLELVRSKIEMWVWGLCSSRKLRKHHFEYRGEACFLTHKGKQVFYEEYLDAVLQWRTSLRRYSRFYSNFLQKKAIK